MNQKVLLVDDDETLRRLFGFVLKHEGYEVFEAGTGMEALAMVDVEDFDLLVVDVMMPVLDGLRLLTLLRRERGFEAPVLVLTSMDRAGAEEDIRASGASDVAIKPLSHIELLDRVRVLLGD